MTAESNPLAAVLIANGWASQAQIDRVRSLAGPGLLRTLMEQNIITPEDAAAAEALLLQQAQLPNFSLLRKLGAGGMGTVYLATHHASGQQVALKVISTRLADDAEFLSRFHRESHALVGLRHPNLANVIESGTHGSTHYLAMEHVSGPSAAGLLKEYRALPEHYVLMLVRQLADCLAYVYRSAGLVHRDIKPENILIQRVATSGELFPSDDQAKLIDFGLVKVANDDEHLTQTGMTIGTPLYMSPEQVRGEKLDCRSDIYGLGATIHHLLTGAPPFRGTSPGAIMSAHLTEPVPDPSDAVPSLCPATRRLVMTAMIKDVDRRYLGFDAFIKACDEAIEEQREKSGSSIRLLRKPLIIAKKTPRRAGTDRIDEPPTANAKALPAIPAAPRAPESAASDRIQRKHAERRQAGDSQRHAAAAPTPPPRSAASELIKVQTDKILRQRQARSSSETIAPPPTPAPPSASDRSAVYAEDAAATSGTGPLPWLILAGAVVVAIAIVAFQLTRR